MKKVTMYSGDPCPYCGAAKALLKTKNVEIEEFDIWADPAKAVSYTHLTLPTMLPV